MYGACDKGHLKVAQWLFDNGAAEDVRTADRDGDTPMFWACCRGYLRVVQWLYDVGAAEDVRRANKSGKTPMLYGKLEVVLWLILNGAANNNSTGRVDQSIIIKEFRLSEEPLSFHVSKKQKVQSAMEDLLSDHCNFISIFLPAVYSGVAAHGSLIPEPEKNKPNKLARKSPMRTSLGPCHLPKLRGLESSVVAHVADFAGVVRGRQLRNLRGAIVCFDGLP